MRVRHSSLKWFLLALLVPAGGFAHSDWTDKSPHRSGFVTANNVRLHYLNWGGKGETMLLLHGLGDTAHIFDDLAPRFTDRFRVLGLTRRGHGQSDKPDAGYDTATLVEDVRQFLAAMNVRRVILVGHSLAGDELTRFAGLHSDIVIKLVYLDAAHDRAGFLELMKGAPPALSPSKADIESLESFRRWVSRMSFWSEAWEANLRDMMSYSVDGKILGEAKPDHVTRSLIRGTIESHPDYAKVKAPALNIAAVGFSFKAWDAVRALPDPERTKAEEFLSKLARHQKEQTERFRRSIPNGKLVELQDTDHHCFIQREDDVVREMRAFLAD
jgi:non-heme chloroperoxidase